MGSVHITVIRLHVSSSDLPDLYRKYYAQVTIDDKAQTTPHALLRAGWDRRLTFNDVQGSSKIMIEVIKRHKLLSDELIGTYEEGVENLLAKSLNGSESIMLPLRNCTSKTKTFRIELKVDVEVNQDSAAMAAIIQRAKIQASRLQRSPSLASSFDVSIIQPTSSNVDYSPEEVTAPFITLLVKLQMLSNLTRSIAEISPYAAAACSVMTLAYNTFHAQMQRDVNILALINIMVDIYSFVKEAEPLGRIESHKKVITRISQQTTECGYFITAYFSDRSFLIRTMKHSLATTDAAIVSYGNKFSELKEALLDYATIDTEITVLRILDMVQKIETKVDLGDLPYANGARFQGSRGCLPGTREETLNKIISWIDNPTPDGKRLFLLTGATGTGKSAIAHSIAGHYNALGRLGSSIFADLPQDPLTRSGLPTLLFPTIARDLADLDPQYRHVLWNVIESKKALRKALDPVEQCEKFIVAPSNSLAISGPIVIVMDALDECPSSHALSQFLSVLAQHAHDLPPNFRIIITARAGSYMLQYFRDVARTYEIDNTGWSAKYDLSQVAKSHLRSDLTTEQLKDFDDTVVSEFVEQSQGSFRRMIKACNAICGVNSETYLQKLSPFKRHQTLISRSQNSRLPVQPDDSLYMQELAAILAGQGASFRARFKSIMGILLAACRPLSMLELMHISDDLEEGAILQLDGLLRNTTHLYAPITPFYSSFYDFLRDPARSREFFVDVSGHHSSLAKACLRVLCDKLHFNICHLESSYLPNAEVINLPDRTERYIGPELSYASQFWIQHLVKIPPEALAPEAEIMLQTRLLFWLEVLSVLGRVEIAIDGLQALASWGSESIRDLANVALSFIQTFEPAITLSAPHIYVSGIRFWPSKSSQRFEPHFTFPPLSKSTQQMHHRVRSFGQTVTLVTLSPDCNSILVAYVTRDAYHYCLWDLVSDKIQSLINIPLARIQGIPQRIPCGVFSSDGETISAYTPTSEVKILNTKTGEVEFEQIVEHNTSYGVMQPDGKQFAYAMRYTSSNFIRFVSTDDLTQKAVGLAPDTDKNEYITCLAFSPLGNFLACGTNKGSISLWNVRTRNDIFVSSGTNFSLPVALLTFSPDESRLFSGHHSRLGQEDYSSNCIQVITWNQGRYEHKEPKILWQKRVRQGEDPLGQIITSPTGRYLLYTNWAVLHFIDLESPDTADPIPPLVSGSDSPITSMAFSNDESMIVAGDKAGSVHVWRVSKPFGAQESLWEKGDASGWIHGPKKELLAWVPPELRDELNWNRLVAGEAHGVSWIESLVKN
ncbi:hypothetical protein BT96DRAFT_1026345 [Gymnopus androsaceus JB14]|uniref:Nephrocystin 3-like N-terminal domain-containing protein n=1 Tax=Gymnopus androsaceus JB14 TaxID=1447944 RepID=A0A6A4GLQ1_9AGAR|nr:hypothetical protein BT96DRAFT_1026345 [Gymnopus androsaceus JB14]